MRYFVGVGSKLCLCERRIVYTVCNSFCLCGSTRFICIEPNFVDVLMPLSCDLYDCAPAECVCIASEVIVRHIELISRCDRTCFAVEQKMGNQSKSTRHGLQLTQRLARNRASPIDEIYDNIDNSPYSVTGLA